MHQRENQEDLGKILLSQMKARIYQREDRGDPKKVQYQDKTVRMSQFNLGTLAVHLMELSFAECMLEVFDRQAIIDPGIPLKEHSRQSDGFVLPATSSCVIKNHGDDIKNW
jgi:hypothetical protein